MQIDGSALVASAPSIVGGAATSPPMRGREIAEYGRRLDGVRPAPIAGSVDRDDEFDSLDDRRSVRC